MIVCGISWECQYHEEALSARSELHSRLLAEQAQACKGPHKGGKAARPDGTYRDHWLQLGKTAFLARHPCTGSHANLRCIVQKKKISNCACHPCAGAMQSLLKKDYTSRNRHPCAGTTLIFNVSPQLRRNLTGSCVFFALLDVLSRDGRR